jgi:S-adenosylmethionine:tRNA ribosyltransferase-isomerase
VDAAPPVKPTPQNAERSGLRTSDFDYELPPELIAQQPLPDRAASRMMVLERATGRIRHDEFRNLAHHLQPGDLLVLNDTKVIPARLWSKTPAVEWLLLENLGENRWSTLARPAKRARPGTAVLFEDGQLTATVIGETDFGGRVLQFSGDLDGYLEKFGAAPLPPYIKRTRRERADLERYQTVFARVPGSVAAPTAGLHFTAEMLETLPHAFITLHVGLGTFQPVRTENIKQHKMHSEWFSIPPETRAAIETARRVIAVGTTVVRALESGKTEGWTDLFITPGFQFRVVGALLTNFHLPRSTLLMLVCAFAGRELILRAYEEAVRERYRFFSYGDCMLIL